MTIIGIWKAKRELYEILLKMPGDYNPNRTPPICSLAKRIGAPIAPEQNEVIRNIHIVLQTEMMLQACIFAAASAIVSCISVVLFLFFR